MTTAVRVGVTGATGQVGARLLRHLRDAGISAVAAVRNPLGAALCDAAAPGCEIRIGSLIPVDGQPHMLDDCDVIVHCAIESSGGIPRQAYTRNRALVDGLLKAKSLKWLVHFSTVAVYGELLEHSDDPDRTRRHPRPTSEYGRSKLFVERHAARQAHARGIGCTIVRLGHVYGPGIARSREIVELAKDPAFRLPFGGRYPSNAIHVDRLGAAIVGLLSGPRYDICGLAERSTWRDVFDWHTGCLGLPPVLEMPEPESEARRAAVLDQSPGRDLVAWLKHLPIKSLVRSPAMFDLALRILVMTPSSVTRRLSDVNRRTGAGGHIARHAEAAPVPSLYLSSGMPGPFLDLPAAPDRGLGADAERARELQEWYDLWRAPNARAAVVTSSRLRERDHSDSAVA
jgi:nucleoside-diphosphate-sugar epimerase